MIDYCELHRHCRNVIEVVQKSHHQVKSSRNARNGTQQRCILNKDKWYEQFVKTERSLTKISLQSQLFVLPTLGR